MAKRLFATAVVVCGSLSLGLWLRAAEAPRLDRDQGEEELARLLGEGFAHPQSLASADLNGDGAPDLVTAYAVGQTGIVTVRLGNTDAYAPTEDAWAGRTAQKDDSSRSGFIAYGDFGPPPKTKK